MFAVRRQWSLPLGAILSHNASCPKTNFSPIHLKWPLLVFRHHSQVVRHA